MSKSKSNKIKACFLLIVFFLNTVVGFACSVGLQMGFNPAHHLEKNAVESPASTQHRHEAHHHHDHQEIGHQEQDEKHTKGNCCKDEVAKLEKVAKVTTPSFSFDHHPVSFTLFSPPCYLFSLSPSCTSLQKGKYAVQDHHPPIPDIRIAIQSFQI